MHRVTSTAGLLNTARQTLTTRLTTQHKLTLWESALMIHLNHATHAFFCTYLSKESAKQPASPLSSRQLSPCAHTV